MTDTTMSDPIFESYKEAAEHQLREWAEGRPWHNPWSPMSDAPIYGDRSEGECCPDFSCCYPAGIWARERRFQFIAAKYEDRFSMLIGALVNLTDPDAVYVAGGTDGDN